MRKENIENIVLIFLMMISVVFILLEIVNNVSSTGLFLGGLAIIILSKKLAKQSLKEYVIIGSIMIILALIQTVSAWITLVLLIVIIAGKNQHLFNTVKDALLKHDHSIIDNEFISIKLNQYKERPIKRIRKNWIGEEKKDTDIYEWEDINYTKLAGDSVIDLGNTIIPKGDNVILIRKAIGNVKILVPEEVAVSLDVSVFLGKIGIGEDELMSNNEVIKYRSDHYDDSSRRLKVVTNVILGNVEVVFL